MDRSSALRRRIIFYRFFSTESVESSRFNGLKVYPVGDVNLLVANDALNLVEVVTNCNVCNVDLVTAICSLGNKAERNVGCICTGNNCACITVSRGLKSCEIDYDNCPFAVKSFPNNLVTPAIDSGIVHTESELEAGYVGSLDLDNYVVTCAACNFKVIVSSAGL